MAMNAITLHTAKRIVAVRPRSPRNRDTLVREAASRDGWAYATALRDGARVVIAVSDGCAVQVGQVHGDLDTYTNAEAALDRLGYEEAAGAYVTRRTR